MLRDDARCVGEAAYHRGGDVCIRSMFLTMTLDKEVQCEPDPANIAKIGKAAEFVDRLPLMVQRRDQLKDLITAGLNAERPKGPWGRQWISGIFAGGDCKIAIGVSDELRPKLFPSACIGLALSDRCETDRRPSGDSLAHTVPEAHGRLGGDLGPTCEVLRDQRLKEPSDDTVIDPIGCHPAAAGEAHEPAQAVAGDESEMSSLSRRQSGVSGAR